jgi:hypothetical protein
LLPPLALDPTEDDPDIGFRQLICPGYDPLILVDGEIYHKDPRKVTPEKQKDKLEHEQHQQKGKKSDLEATNNADDGRE